MKNILIIILLLSALILLTSCKETKCKQVQNERIKEVAYVSFLKHGQAWTYQIIEVDGTQQFIVTERGFMIKLDSIPQDTLKLN